MADDYAYQAAKTSARALAGAAGFDVVQHSCLDILAGLIVRYMRELGTGSHHYAELAGRSETNPVDVVRASLLLETAGHWGAASMPKAIGAAAPPCRLRLSSVAALRPPALACLCRRWRSTT